MTAGARTPEELDTILEDAFVSRDRALSRALFEDHSVLVQAEGAEARGGEAIGHALAGAEVRGGESIGHALAELWDRDRTYVAPAGRVLQARDVALLVSSAAIHVLRRGGDGTWRAAISLLLIGTPNGSEDT
jgi:hypothetical protein